MTDAKTVRTMCPMNCHPTQCGMLAEIEDGKVISVTGDPDNPDSQGFLCVRGQASKEIIDNPKRILNPMIRDERTDDAWREATWEEALDRIAGKMQSLRPDETGIWAGHGILSNGYGVYGVPQMIGRFANLYGCQTWSGAMICWGLGGFGAGLTGVQHTHTKMDMAENADMILMWAANFASQPTTTPFIMQAKKRGAKLVVIDVRETEAMAQADEAFIIPPGTDSALALGLMHVIIDEGLHDAGFIADHTVGFDELSEEVKSYTAARVAEITGIEASRIIDLARSYAKTKPAMIHLGGSSILKGSNGWRATRAITCLPALTGNLGIPGGGFGPRHGTTAQGTGLNHVVAPERKPAGNYIPNQMPEVAASLEDGRVKAMLLLGSNIMSSYADSGQVARGLDRVELVVTYELFMTETVRRFADVVLPATAWLEDLGAKGTHTHIYLCEKALEPAGQARPMQDVFKGLSDRLGIEDYYPWESHEEFFDAILDHPSTGQASVASIRANDGRVELNISHVAYHDHAYSTPSGKVEFYSERAKDAGLPPLPVYEERPKDEFPLTLTQGRTLTQFHSFYDHGRALPMLAKRDPGSEVWISTEDAAARDLDNGRTVRVFNDLGSFEAAAVVTDKIPAGVVWTRDGMPGLSSVMSGARALPDTAVDMFPFTVGQSAYEATVDVEAA